MISVAMIVKNEEAVLARALLSVKGLADQVVVVDTGSTDDTKKIAMSHGAHVHGREWRNDFSWARNESLELCTEPWILILDADEEVVREDHDSIRRFCLEAPANGAYFKVLSELASGQWRTTSGLRMFKNGIGAHYQKPIHNELVGVQTAATTDLRIRHYGYAATPEEWAKKAAIRLPAMDQAVEDHPEDPLVWFHRMQMRKAAGMFEESAADGEMAIRRSASGPAHIRAMALFETARALIAQKKKIEAIPKLQKAAGEFPRYIDPPYALTLIYIDLERWSQAEDQLRSYFRRLQLGPDHLSLISETYRNKESAMKARSMLALAREQRAALCPA